jgi:predicted LPLAT superfamily acyltransferase
VLSLIIEAGVNYLRFAFFLATFFLAVFFFAAFFLAAMIISPIWIMLMSGQNQKHELTFEQIAQTLIR